MIYFKNDYSRGTHPRVLEWLAAHNVAHYPGYGEDELVGAAQQLLRGMLGHDSCQLHLVAGGTQANLLVIAGILRPHQAVVATQDGHIFTHETGAIEATGHRVIALESPDGKLRPEQISQLMQAHRADANRCHSVQPGMVYISQTTELGTVYSLAELQALYALCRAEGLLLYIDGARLGHALASEGADVTLPDMATVCDVFTIGLTKQGALFGEAVVVNRPELLQDFRYLIKQRGAMLAKGWLLGLQFLALFEDGLYLQLARQANAQALAIRDGLQQLGISCLSQSPSNQQFPVLPNALIASLSEGFAFETIRPMDAGHTCIRLVTSWATQDSEVRQLLEAVAQLLQP